MGCLICSVFAFFCTCVCEREREYVCVCVCTRGQSVLSMVAAIVGHFMTNHSDQTNKIRQISQILVAIKNFIIGIRHS